MTSPGDPDDRDDAGDRDDERPARVRVPRDVGTPPTTLGIALPGAPVREAGAVFDRSLVRGQLRLALGCLIGFLLVAGAFTAVIIAIAAVHDPIVVGVPLSWLLQAYGYYPLILFFAIVFARAAGRNERRYRELSDGPEGGGDA